MGILFLKFGLGAKVAGAKTLTHAIIKAGGKKAVVIATAGMLTKRHIIDIVSRFFAEHSINRYKKTLTLVILQKINEIRESTIAKKLKAFGSMLLSIPMVYIFWTKVLGTAIQKFIYALALPLITFLWNFIITSFNFLGFIFQLLMLNIFLETISKYEIGKKIIYAIDRVILLIAYLLNIINTLLSYFGIDPKASLVKLSNIFNRWLESILDKGLSPISRLYNRRRRYINIVEGISERRFITKESRANQRGTSWVYIKKLFEKIVLKRRDWRELRATRAKRWDNKKSSRAYSIRQRVISRQAKGEPLTLPYHITQIVRVRGRR